MLKTMQKESQTQRLQMRWRKEVLKSSCVLLITRIVTTLPGEKFFRISIQIKIKSKKYIYAIAYPLNNLNHLNYLILLEHLNNLNHILIKVTSQAPLKYLNHLNQSNYLKHLKHLIYLNHLNQVLYVVTT